jgi:hypothetical protein
MTARIFSIAEESGGPVRAARGVAGREGSHRGRANPAATRLRFRIIVEVMVIVGVEVVVYSWSVTGRHTIPFFKNGIVWRLNSRACRRKVANLGTSSSHPGNGRFRENAEIQIVPMELGRIRSNLSKGSKN